MTYVIADGNAFGGVTLVGPFNSEQAAIDYAEHRTMPFQDDWHIVQLVMPEPDLDRYERQWVDTAIPGPDGRFSTLTFDECAQLGLDGTGRS